MVGYSTAMTILCTAFASLNFENTVTTTSSAFQPSIGLRQSKVITRGSLRPVFAITADQQEEFCDFMGKMPSNVKDNLRTMLQDTPEYQSFVPGEHGNSKEIKEIAQSISEEMTKHILSRIEEIPGETVLKALEPLESSTTPDGDDNTAAIKKELVESNGRVKKGWGFYIKIRQTSY